MSVTYTGSNNDFDSPSQSCSSQEEPKMELSNLQWKKEGSEAEKALVKNNIQLCADVANAEDGERVRIKVYERDENGRDNFVANIYGDVQGSKVNFEWKIRYKPKKNKEESVQEMQEKAVRFPQYVFKHHNIGKNLAESGVLELADQVEIEAIDEATGEPLANVAFTLVLPDGSLQEGTLDGNGYAKIKDLPPNDGYPIIFHNENGHGITLAKK